MCRTLILIAATLLVGCGQSERATTQDASPTIAAVEPPSNTEALHFDKAGGRISLDTSVAVGQRRRFDIGQGSITVETLRTEGKLLIFQYTPEIEGGYTTYECTAVIGNEPVVFRVNPDGTPGLTSFDLTKCKVVGGGNVHFETGN